MPRLGLWRSLQARVEPRIAPVRIFPVAVTDRMAGRARIGDQNFRAVTFRLLGGEADPAFEAPAAVLAWHTEFVAWAVSYAAVEDLHATLRAAVIEEYVAEPVRGPVSDYDADAGPLGLYALSETFALRNADRL